MGSAYTLGKTATFVYFPMIELGQTIPVRMGSEPILGGSHVASHDDALCSGSVPWEPLGLSSLVFPSLSGLANLHT